MEVYLTIPTSLTRGCNPIPPITVADGADIGYQLAVSRSRVSLYIMVYRELLEPFPRDDNARYTIFADIYIVAGQSYNLIHQQSHLGLPQALH
jgi:hypothetical protein